MKVFVLLILCLCLFSCEEGPKCYDYKTVLNVSPHHATRVYVTYTSKCGDTITATEHCSTTIKADNITFGVSDYLDGKLQYGDVDTTNHK